MALLTGSGRKEFIRGGRKMKKISTQQIGDGKIPNKYWVSIDEDYLYYDRESSAWESAGERDGNDGAGKTVAVFSSYEKARELFDSILMGELYDGIIVNGKCIEDRLSGEIAEERGREMSRIEYEEYEDLRFTQKSLAEKGVKFK
jgi:hypothetical protein